MGGEILETAWLMRSAVLWKNGICRNPPPRLKTWLKECAWGHLESEGWCLGDRNMGEPGMNSEVCRIKAEA